jgi:hypothetical protein
MCFRVVSRRTASPPAISKTLENTRHHVSDRLLRWSRVDSTRPDHAEPVRGGGAVRPAPSAAPPMQLRGRSVLVNRNDGTFARTQSARAYAPRSTTCARRRRGPKSPCGRGVRILGRVECRIRIDRRNHIKSIRRLAASRLSHRRENTRPESRTRPPPPPGRRVHARNYSVSGSHASGVTVVETVEAGPPSLTKSSSAAARAKSPSSTASLIARRRASSDDVGRRPDDASTARSGSAGGTASFGAVCTQSRDDS